MLFMYCKTGNSILQNQKFVLTSSHQLVLKLVAWSPPLLAVASLLSTDLLYTASVKVACILMH